MFAAALLMIALASQNVEVLSADTFRANGEVYRLYNVDAPQLGTTAQCRREITRAGDTATYVRTLIAGAHTVSITPGFDPRGRGVWPHDRAGRRLARVMIDGQDLHDLLIAQGRAAPFDRYQEYNWCGRS